MKPLTAYRAPVDTLVTRRVSLLLISYVQLGTFVNAAQIVPHLTSDKMPMFVHLGTTVQKVSVPVLHVCTRNAANMYAKSDGRVSESEG